MSIIVDESTIRRVRALRAEQGKSQLLLRITVEGGGCSGFQYKLSLTEQTAAHDTLFADAVVTDDISLPFLKGAVVRFEDSLTGSAFKIDNPNAVSGCGCGTSFAV